MHECVRALLQYKALDSVLYVALLGKKDGSGQSAHLRNMIILFFFVYLLRWMYIPKTHSGLQIIQKKYPATSCGIKHKKLYLKSVFKSTT